MPRAVAKQKTHDKGASGVMNVCKQMYANFADSGDFIHDVDNLINVLNEIGSDPAKQKKLEEMIKEYKEAKS